MQSSIGRTTLSPGTYYMYAIVKETENYYGATTDTKQFAVKTAIAKVGNTNYPSIAAAIASISSSGTVTMIINRAEGVTIPSGKVITLDTAGKTITGNFTNNGTLNVSGTGKITADSGDTITNYGTFTLANATIENTDSEKYSSLCNAGTATINSGTMQHTGAGYGIWVSDGTVNIGGTAKIKSVSGSTIASLSGTTKISGGEIFGAGAATIWNQAILQISGGTIHNDGSAQAVVTAESGSSATISGTANIYTSGADTVGITNNSTLTMSGGTITNNSTQGFSALANGIGSLTVTGGTIKHTGPGYGIWTNSGTTAVISGGTIENSGSGYAISNSGEMEINSSPTIKNTGTLHGIVNSGYLEINGTPTISSQSQFALFSGNTSNAELWIKGGTITSYGNAAAAVYIGDGAANMLGNAVVSNENNYNAMVIDRNGDFMMYGGRVKTSNHTAIVLAGNMTISGGNVNNNSSDSATVVVADVGSMTMTAGTLYNANSSGYTIWCNPGGSVSRSGGTLNPNRTYGF